MSDFFNANPDELLKPADNENRQDDLDMLKRKILDDFEELKFNSDLVYPNPVQPSWKN